MVHALKALALFGAAFTLAQAASIPVSRSSKHVSRKAKRKCSGPTTPVPVPPPSTGDQQPVPDPEPEPVPEPTPEPDNGSDGKYNKKDDFIGEDFYNQFDFFTGDDPTHGRVDYVDMNTARGMNLTSVGANSFILRADQGYTDPGSRGRKSVRIGSKNSYETHVLVADVLHIPEGTPSWPALWEVGANWPNNGELDIIEGVNDRGPNLMSLHTSGGCVQQWGGRDMKGTGHAENCDWLANGNQGCGASGDSPESFGPSFNAVRGGWYAVERTDSYIKIWFWGRNDNSVPDEVRNNVRGVNPDAWGRPTVLFNNDGCNIGEKFGPNQLIINLTFCGDWAGATYPGGPQACINDVNNGGDWTSRSFWEIARISMYT